MRLIRPSQETVNYIKNIAKETIKYMCLDSPEIFRRFEQNTNQEQYLYIVGTMPNVNSLSTELNSIILRINDDLQSQVKLYVK